MAGWSTRSAKKTIRRDDERIDVVVEDYDPELPPLPLGPPVSKTNVCCDWGHIFDGGRASRLNESITCLENQSHNL